MLVKTERGKQDFSQTAELKQERMLSVKELLELGISFCLQNLPELKENENEI